MIVSNTKLTVERFIEHMQTAKALSILANGSDTKVDNMLDDLAACLDALHGTKSFSSMAETN